MIQFLGNIEAKVDAKGRVFVPVVFRKELTAHSQGSLVLRKDIFQNCLTLYPQEVWDEEVATLRSRLSKWDREQKQIFRQFVVDAERVEMDANGRILIAKRYLEMIDAQSDVIFVGFDNTIEVWANGNLKKTLLPADDFGAKIEQLMNNNTDTSGQ